MNINDFYIGILAGLMQAPKEYNKRTGIHCYALPGVTYQTDLERDGFPLLSIRKMSLAFVPEVLWAVSGSDNVRPFLSKHTKIWDAFAEEDGTVTAAYGARWAVNNQLQNAIKRLKADPTSRHSVIITWNVWSDGVIQQKNVPCPFAFTLMIIGGRLHMHNIVRSNDMVLGFPTDVASFALLQMMIAQELGIPAGIYTHSISNCHFYENQLLAVEEMMTRAGIYLPVRLELPPNAYQQALQPTDELVAEIKSGIMNYRPLPAIPNIPIAI